MAEQQTDGIERLIEMCKIQAEQHFPERGIDFIGQVDQRSAELRDQVRKTWGAEPDSEEFWAGLLVGVHWSGLLVQHLFKQARETRANPPVATVLRVLVMADAIAAQRMESVRQNSEG